MVYLFHSTISFLIDADIWPSHTPSFGSDSGTTETGEPKVSRKGMIDDDDDSDDDMMFGLFGSNADRACPVLLDASNGESGRSLHCSA